VLQISRGMLYRKIAEYGLEMAASAQESPRMLKNVTSASVH
jgi:hypothetical protein